MFQGGYLESALEPCSDISNRLQWLLISTEEIQAAQGPYLQQLLLWSYCTYTCYITALWDVLASHRKLDYLSLLWSFLHFSESSGFYMHIKMSLYKPL